MTKAVLLGMLAVFLIVGGCGKQNAEIVAEVNGTQLTRKQLDERVDKIKQEFEMYGLQLDGEEGAEMLAMFEKEGLNQLIMETVFYDEVKKQNISVSDKEIEEVYNQVVEAYGEDVIAEMLKQQNLTEKELKADIEMMLLQNSLFDKVTADVSVSEEQVREYFEANKDSLIQYRASHILIMPDKEAEDQEKADEEAKAKAEALIRELDQGADFAQLAKENSADGSAANGGDLGQYFTKAQSPYVPEFTEGAVSLAKGEYTKEPVKSVFGYHIIKLTDKKETLDELREDIEAQLLSSEKNRLFDEYFAKAMEEADIVNYLEQEEAGEVTE